MIRMAFSISSVKVFPLIFTLDRVLQFTIKEKVKFFFMIKLIFKITPYMSCPKG
ncbi:hypothetical protein MICCA_630008 [Microcystis aeruginosa PCC 9432]|uniref:Uncharacterized protein n=1 Tax=Microcystis aeruginosa PCC 9432 TaxID=1160280 RepID=A0A830ZXZ0_MICAE|nr:hypothetical protein MICCA_630008 [Microcystis aeruginosa PCC 9432]CCI07678.1 hypothetical protein MICAD_2670014 [Microcystis aeruginosa PCC 7941]